MSWQNHIVSDPQILVGKPTIKGTRISIELILDHLNNGWDKKMILEAYPHLTIEQLDAGFEFIKECINNESHLMLKKSA